MNIFITPEQYNKIYSEKSGIIITSKIEERIGYLQTENKKLREALNDWVQWENGQIIMNGEYSGEEINRLINKAREALKEVGEE